jgi:uncharacterized membrane protein (UPF0127 family)
MVLGCGGGAVETEEDQTLVVHETPRGGGEPERVVPRVELERQGAEPVSVRVEVADDDDERARGLMFRRHLAPDAGMLFVFEEPKTASFWMKNTFIPLDVLFIGEDLTILGIVTDTVPLSEDSIEIDQPSRYVLEVNAGFVRTHGIVAGSEIALVGVSLTGESP